MAFDPDYLLSLPPRQTTRSYTFHDTILYALGVGAGQDLESDDLCFVYEEGLKALPTMAVVLGYPGFWQKEPQYGIDWKKILHAEQSVTFHRPIPSAGDVRSEMIIESIVDKGAAKGALLTSLRRLSDGNTGELLATIRQVSFLRGNGGQGGSSSSAPPPHALPDGSADFAVPMKTRPEQALLYRLSGDLNPLHVDPAVAHGAGQPRPILHGLCTYAIAGRVLLREMCGNSVERLARLDARFTAPVLPGDELLVSIWREGEGRAKFRVEVPARGVTALDNGYAEFAGP